ncbi:uncharacterized protein RJT20DRAFT_130909 [Scheffersomyces xylosifermentans]|uniref:uncharacterized protein n=1 Tax=Scheffersomyces xylosifermentans TaxID=1304137 RepID=UPI00315D2D23
MLIQNSIYSVAKAVSRRGAVSVGKTPNLALLYCSYVSSNRTYSTKQINIQEAIPTQRSQNETSSGKEELQTIVSNLNRYKTTFPKDLSTISKIDLYKDIDVNKFAIQTIRIGVVYDTHQAAKSSKLIESILADPFANDNQIWFDAIVSRQRDGINVFKFSNNVEISNNGSNYRIPSPILSRDYRPSYMNNLIQSSANSSTPNDIEIWEINDNHNVDFNNLHFLIAISDDFASSLNSYSDGIKHKIFLRVIDNNEWTPTSTESTPVSFTTIQNTHTHIIKIASNTALSGINEFLAKGTEAATSYFDGITKSNIFELNKALGYFSSSDILLQVLLEDIRSTIANSLVEPSEITNINTELKREIAEFGNFAHSELQYSLVPETTKFFKRKLPWWKLYYKNDNVEYDLKDFFNENFMNRSIESYNFMRGNIAAKVKEQDFSGSSRQEGSNPILNLKNSIITQRISTEVQPIVYKAITTAFLFYQLPVSILSFGAYQYFSFTPESAAALALLGWVVGFNHVSKVWESFNHKWLSAIFEDVRLSISRDCIDEGLSKELIHQSENELHLSTIKKEILQGLNGESK